MGGSTPPLDALFFFNVLYVFDWSIPAVNQFKFQFSTGIFSYPNICNLTRFQIFNVNTKTSFFPIYVFFYFCCWIPYCQAVSSSVRKCSGSRIAVSGGIRSGIRLSAAGGTDTVRSQSFYAFHPSGNDGWRYMGCCRDRLSSDGENRRPQRAPDRAFLRGSVLCRESCSCMEAAALRDFAKDLFQVPWLLFYFVIPLNWAFRIRKSPVSPAGQ